MLIKLPRILVSICLAIIAVSIPVLLFMLAAIYPYVFGSIMIIAFVTFFSYMFYNILFGKYL